MDNSDVESETFLEIMKKAVATAVQVILEDDSFIKKAWGKNKKKTGKKDCFCFDFSIPMMRQNNRKNKTHGIMLQDNLIDGLDGDNDVFLDYMTDLSCEFKSISKR